MNCCGTLKYKTGYATIPVNFPEGSVNCANCTYLRERPLRGMCQCGLTDVYIDVKSMKDLPDFCPVIFNEEEE